MVAMVYGLKVAISNFSKVRFHFLNDGQMKSESGKIEAQKQSSRLTPVTEGLNRLPAIGIVEVERLKSEPIRIGISAILISEIGNSLI
ncbi:hypothetical protein L2E82_48898 [Cichorium intybus]|uniref:Uncharacterized protein n=1 Tax=Cichorium intybus TaxID=13427 RepID=A0ACB8YZ76_CICIN|nr:hypothetical protein L2E82_48898 [Cichorium intybus]